jgi:rare lipoprotein A
MHFFAPLVILALCTLGSCCPGEQSYGSVSESSGGERPESEHRGDVLRGQVSYYSNALSGRRTASGERYDPKKYTAASRTLPFGTRVKVTRLDTGKSVIVRVNDRGPFGHRRRILDISRAAAEDLGIIRKGLVQVEAVVLD